MPSSDRYLSEADAVGRVPFTPLLLAAGPGYLPVVKEVWEGGLMCLLLISTRGKQ